MVFTVESTVPSNDLQLSRWRRNSSFMQAFLVNMIVFCGQGMLSTILGLGAGGGRPSNIQLVDKIYIVTSVASILTGFVSGGINNKVGPRWICIFGAAGYPIYVGSLWWLDSGGGAWLAYVAALYLGSSAALLFCAAGYIISSYSTESTRGKYIASLGIFENLGTTTGAAIALGITTGPGSTTSHISPAVYITIICIQSCGILFAISLIDPSKVRRNDGRAIAFFPPVKWVEEFKTLPKTLCTRKTILLLVGLFSCQMTYSLLPAVNAFYFNARTRALINLTMVLSGCFGCVLQAFFCDAKWFGNRRQRALKAGTASIVLMIGAWAGLFAFLTAYRIDRTRPAPSVDWSEGSRFANLLVVFITLNWSLPFTIGYLQWLCSSFSNDPAVLARYTAYVLTLKQVGLVTANGIDSRGTPFLTEAGVYFPLSVVGSILAIVSASKYTKDSKYGEEETVIVPKAFERIDGHNINGSTPDTSESKEHVIHGKD